VASFTVNPTRFDPYKNFKFRVRWDGTIIPGVDRITALRRETGVLTHRDGEEPGTDRRSPGVSVYEPITLCRGRTHDTAFEAWANKVWDLGASPGSEVSLKDFRKDISIELLNEAGQVALAWKVFRCWPSEYVALGDLDANGNAVAVEHLKLENEGWERDTSVPEPAEPSFNAP
jgi:phage tail-like protein